MPAPWFDPRHNGRGHWEPTPKPDRVAEAVDLIVFVLFLTIALTVFLGVVALGRAAMCSAYDNGLRYCPGYSADGAR
jgi:hypothetical protein